MRIKDQETCLNLHEHEHEHDGGGDDDDNDDETVWKELQAHLLYEVKGKVNMISTAVLERISCFTCPQHCQQRLCSVCRKHHVVGVRLINLSQ